MSQSVTFDTTSGIDLTGWWSDPRTGKSYQVVDQFFQDNVLYVKTTNGQVLNYDVIQNLVKTDAPLQAPVVPETAPLQTQQQQNSLLLDGLLEEDRELISGGSRGVNREPKEPEKSVNELIIEKAFSKAPEPSVTLMIDWDWAGLGDTIGMLTNTMDIPMCDIVDIVYKKYIGAMVDGAKKDFTMYLETQIETQRS